MPAFICNTCGSQFTPSEQPPAECPICLDERQFVPPSGQAWTTLDALARRHFNCYREHERNLIGIGSVPQFAIGQRALLIRTPAGNLLWDCISLVDAATIEIVKGLGGLTGIAISHPHYYSTMVEWSHALGGVPIHLHAADRQWVMRPDPVIKFWDGDTLAAHLGRDAHPLRRPFRRRHRAALGGGRAGRGALLTGDIVQLIPDRRYVSFMRSYPNHDPAVGAGGRAHRRDARALCVRRALRRLVRPRHPAGRQGRDPPLGCTLHRRHHRRRIGGAALNKPPIARDEPAMGQGRDRIRLRRQHE